MAGAEARAVIVVMIVRAWCRTGVIKATAAKINSMAIMRAVDLAVVIFIFGIEVLLHVAI